MNGWPVSDSDAQVQFKLAVGYFLRPVALFSELPMNGTYRSIVPL
jgi:hypothetical protein